MRDPALLIEDLVDVEHSATSKSDRAVRGPLVYVKSKVSWPGSELS